VADEGKVNQKPQQIHKRLQIEVGVWAKPTRFGLWCAPRAHCFFDFAFDLHTPVRRLDLLSASGALRRGLFEHVAAQQIVRVPQPRLLVINQGNPAGAVNRGSPSFGYFSLAKQEK
jgi:hypothetical protein